MTTRCLAEELPEAILDAFRDRAALDAAETAALLHMDPKTLLGHVRDGTIPWHQKGAGTKRPRRVFTLGDVAAYFQRSQRDAPWSTGLETHHTGTSTSSAAVIDLQGRRKSGPSPKPPKSRKRKSLRPSALLLKFESQAGGR